MAAVTLQLDAAVEERLNALAEARKQPMTVVAAEGLTSFVAPESWERRHIEDGMLKLEAGKGISSDRVTQWLDSWEAESEIPDPQSLISLFISSARTKR